MTVICYFLKSIKSVFILVQCNTSLSNNYVAHSIIVVCVIGWIWEKKHVCLHSLCIWYQSQNKDFSQIHIRQQNAWNTLQILNLLKMFKVWMLLNPNSNLVTSLVKSRCNWCPIYTQSLRSQTLYYYYYYRYYYYYYYYLRSLLFLGNRCD